MATWLPIPAAAQQVGLDTEVVELWVATGEITWRTEAIPIGRGQAFLRRVVDLDVLREHMAAETARILR